LLIGFTSIGSPDPSPAAEPEDAPLEADPDVDQDDEVGENEDQELTAEVDGDLDAEPDVEAPSPTPEPSSRSPTPEHDLLDLQPAHRAEALDTLALIELKFALLRERLYVEQMEELVEEEGMVVNGAYVYTYSDVYVQERTPSCYIFSLNSGRDVAKDLS
jgi:hypothetical protein